MEQNHNEGKQNIDNKQDLTDIKTPMLVRDMVKDEVWESGDVGGHVVVGQGRADGGGQEPGAEKQAGYHSLEGFLGNVLIIFIMIVYGHNCIFITFMYSFHVFCF